MPNANSRGVRHYRKPALAHNELLDRWRARGLTITDEARATRYLKHIGYYRLSAYVRSFESNRDVIRAGTTFDEVLSLYAFDRKLRILALDALERIEVAVRAAMNDYLSVEAGPHWFEDNHVFARRKTQQDLLSRIDELVDAQLRRQPERHVESGEFVSALEHYVRTYGEPRRPPAWLVFEELTLGSVRVTYEGLATSHQKAIAQTFRMKPFVLTSWLRSYNRVRNISAHHGRLWNRGLGVYPAIPTHPAVPWLADRNLFTRDDWRRMRLYPVLVTMQSMLHTISPGSSWGARLHDLLEEYPAVPIGSMGIPEHWFEDPFWPRRPHD